MTRTYVRGDDGDDDADADDYDDEYEDYGDDAYEDEYADDEYEDDEYEDDEYADDEFEGDEYEDDEFEDDDGGYYDVYDDEEYDDYDDGGRDSQGGPQHAGHDEPVGARISDDFYDGRRRDWDGELDDLGSPDLAAQGGGGRETAGFDDPGGAHRGARSRTVPAAVVGGVGGETKGGGHGAADPEDDCHADADREAARRAALTARQAARRDRHVAPEPVARRDGTWEDFSWGPEKRSTGLLDRVAPGLVAVVAVALLIAGIAGAVLVHHKKSPKTDVITGLAPVTASTTTVPATTTTTVTTPAGDQRLVDRANHISLAVPTSWVTESLQPSSMSQQLTAVAASNPSVKGIMALDIESLLHAQELGVFAVNVSGNQSVFSYSVASPGTENLSQVPPTAFTTSLKSAGDRNVASMPVHLAVGDAEQITSQSTFEGSTLSEIFDYFVQPGRIVFVALTTKSTSLPTSTFSQIEATIAGA